MSDLAKLKKKAADLEQRRQFDKALAVYEEMLLAQEGSDDADVSLLNRVGDLRLRIGRPAEALDAYERAVDLYVERGFLNNAIALCNKILRQDPTRADVHYRLGRISAEKGFRSDAKRHFLEYAGLMQVSGRLDEAFTALAEFADLSPEHSDVRLMLAEQLARHDRAEEAVAQLTTVLERFEAERRFAEADEVAERIRALDPTFAAPEHAELDPADLDSPGTPGRRSTPSRGANGMPDLVLIDPSESVAGARAAAAGPVETSGTADTGHDVLSDVPAAEGFSAGSSVDLVGDQASALLADEVAPHELVLDGFESTGISPQDLAPETARGDVGGVFVEGLDQFEPTSLAADAPATEPMGEHLELASADIGESFARVDAGGAGDAADERPGSLDLAAIDLELPADGASERPEADDAPFDAVDAAFLSYEGEEIVVDEAAHEAAHEAAGADAAMGAPAAEPLDAPLDDPLLDDLIVGEDRADATPSGEGRTDEGESAPLVGYGFEAEPLVIEDDHLVAEEAPRGDAALRFDAPAEPASSDDSFINLGDLLRSEDGPRSTRMVTEEKAPTGDEQADFAEMLRKFKQGVAENVDDGDFESHHDLGVAYKEMGLLDEAVAAFQRALRGTPHRARTYEALGHCFLEREQYAVASGVLQRALSEPGADDQQLVGVLYLLGRAAEAMNQRDEALSYYQRVFAVDIEFADVADRMESVVQVAR